jgi:hypothetical protein
MLLIIKWQREVYLITKYIFPLFDKCKEIGFYWLFLGNWVNFSSEFTEMHTTDFYFKNQKQPKKVFDKKTFVNFLSYTALTQLYL